MSAPPPGYPRVLAHLIYEDVDAAIAWLTDVFGFHDPSFEGAAVRWI